MNLFEIMEGIQPHFTIEDLKNLYVHHLNHVVCHGVPSKERILEEGDALNVDVTAIINDHYGDTSRMFCIGKTSVKLNNLIRCYL